MISKKCVSCRPTRALVAESHVTPYWLSKINYVSRFKQNTAVRIKRPNRMNKTEIQLNIAPKYHGCLVLCWGAQPKPTLPLNSAASAYGSFKNYTAVPVSKHGLTTVHLQCPQVYTSRIKKSDAPVVYPRHVHFSLSDKKRTQWQPAVYTQRVNCNFTFSEFTHRQARKNMVIIDALSYAEYAKHHIPNSQGLPAATADKMTAQALRRWFFFIVKTHYPKIFNAIHQKDIRHIPIIVYCAHDQCQAGPKLISALQRKGFQNLWHYPGGMREYFLKRQ